MNLFEWECFEDIINNGQFVMPEPCVLHAPAYNIKITRDSNLQLSLTSQCDGDAKTNCINRPLGTVRNNDDNTKLVSKLTKNEIQVKAIGSTSYVRTSSLEIGDRITEIANVHSVEGTFMPAEAGCYLFEWLDNMDVSYYQWPHSVEYNKEEKLSILFDKNKSGLSLTSTNNNKNFDRSCVHLTIDGHELYLSKSQNSKSESEGGHGFILYKGTPSEDIRKKIRNCISFALGRPLIYLGNTILNNEFSLVSFSAVSAYNFDGKANKIPTSPPVFLGVTYVHELNEDKFYRLIRGIYQIYDDYELAFIFWQYWHSICSSVHAAPIQYGASIEALRKSISKQNPQQIKNEIVKKSDWKKFSSEVLNIIQTLDIDKTDKTVLENKLGSLNQAPQGILTDRFYKSLNLELTQMEKSAWNRRNDAAHGKSLDQDDYIDLIRDIKILKIIFHRILIRISNGSDDYIDYYSFGHPTRLIKDGVPKS